MIRLKFKKQLRLSNYKNFNSYLRNSYKERVNGIMISGKINNLRIPRIGILIPKKYVKRSSMRNKIKRLVRESFRLNQVNVPNMDFIVFIKYKVSKVDNYILTKMLENLWKRYHQKFPNF